MLINVGFTPGEYDLVYLSLFLETNPATSLLPNMYGSIFSSYHDKKAGQPILYGSIINTLLCQFFFIGQVTLS